MIALLLPLIAISAPPTPEDPGMFPIDDPLATVTLGKLDLRTLVPVATAALAHRLHRGVPGHRQQHLDALLH